MRGGSFAGNLQTARDKGTAEGLRGARLMVAIEMLALRQRDWTPTRLFDVVGRGDDTQSESRMCVAVCDNLGR